MNIQYTIRNGITKTERFDTWADFDTFRKRLEHIGLYISSREHIQESNEIEETIVATLELGNKLSPLQIGYVRGVFCELDTRRRHLTA